MAVTVKPEGIVVVTKPGGTVVVTPKQKPVYVTAQVGKEGPPGPAGPPGTSIEGSVPAYGDLPDLTEEDAGQAWITNDTGHLWVWDGDSWNDVGAFQGPPGPQGNSGGFFVHTQGVPSAVWTIAHDLPYRPNITVVDSAGEQVEGEVDYVGAQIVVTFSAAFSGTAYLS